MKLNAKVLALVAVMAAVTLVLVAASTDVSEQQVMYGGAELSPLTEAYQLWGWNVPRYYYYLFVHLFAGYPWVVRVAYMVIIFCCIAFLVLMTVMMIDFYIRRRNRKRLKEIREKYLEKLKGVCYAEVENLPTEEIKRRLDYKERKWKDWEMRLWSSVFIEASTFTNTQDPNLTNIQRAMRLVGFTDYVERQLLHGKHAVKLQMIQAVRLTNMQLPNGLVTRLVNDKDDELRKASRLYYMCTSVDDPYVFFEEENKLGVLFSQWDMMELHEIFRKVREGGRPTPLFVPILQRVENPSIKAFMMKEIAYWGTDQEMRYLMDFFEAPNFIYRQAAFVSMGIRKFSEAEKAMEKVFYKQTEAVRRTILNSILSINSGRSVTFFRDTYKSGVSQFTKRTALRCLYLYGARGRSMFEMLKATAPASDAILFKHVESPIINYEGD